MSQNRRSFDVLKEEDGTLEEQNQLKKRRSHPADEAPDTTANSLKAETNDAVTVDPTLPLSVKPEEIHPNGFLLDDNWLVKTRNILPMFKQTMPDQREVDAMSGRKHALVVLPSYACIVHSRLHKKNGVEIRLAQNLATREWVNVKTISTKNPMLADNLAREKTILEKLGLLKHHFHDEKTGFSYLIYQHIPGQSLEKLLENKTLDLNTKIEIAIEITQCLIAFHQAGYVHCDIKLENIVAHPITFKSAIIDFDVSVQMDEHGNALTKEPRFTPGYFSPETTKTNEEGFYVYNSRTDLFSFGTALAKWFDVEAYIKSKTPNLFTPPAELIPIIAIIKPMMAKKPEARTVTLEQVVTNLEKSRPNRTVVCTTANEAGPSGLPL